MCFQTTTAKQTMAAPTRIDATASDVFHERFFQRRAAVNNNSLGPAQPDDGVKAPRRPRVGAFFDFAVDEVEALQPILAGPNRNSARRA